MHPQLGASWEGYVIERIMRVTQRKWEYYFYRTQHGAEADLLLIRPDGKTYCLEIKFSQAPVLSRGFYQCLDDIKPDFAGVVVPTGDSYPIIVVSLGNFLQSLTAS